VAEATLAAMRTASFTAPAACALGVALAAVPATAGAATVTLDRSCYAEAELMARTGAGFAPDGSVHESLIVRDPDSSEVLDSFVGAVPIATDGAGAFTHVVHAPTLSERAVRREAATSTFTDDAGTTATAEWTLSGWDMDIPRWSRGKAKPRKRMTVEAWGWTTAPSSTLYAHYVRRGKRAKTVAVGELAGPCGDLTASLRQFPFKPVRSGTWKVYFSATETLDKVDDDWIRYKVRVKPGAAIASAATTVTRHRVSAPPSRSSG
jgi:hypothetical protein